MSSVSEEDDDTLAKIVHYHSKKTYHNSRDIGNHGHHSIEVEHHKNLYRDVQCQYAPQLLSNQLKVLHTTATIFEVNLLMMGSQSSALEDGDAEKTYVIMK